MLMKHLIGMAALLMVCLSASVCAEVLIDEAGFGKSLGGWVRSGTYAQYTISGTKYRTYRPEWTVTPDGGSYVSIRIDHVRGWFSSDDHAVLEVTINPLGEVTTAKSNIAIQGRSISSDVIQGVNDAGTKVSSIDRAVQIGTDLVANISSKLLRAKMVEPGRVSFPSVLRHNYNLLFRSIQVVSVERAEVVGAAPPSQRDSERKVASFTHAAPLEIRDFEGVAKSAKK